MCFKKRVLCRACEDFPLIDLHSHDFSVEVFSPLCSNSHLPRVKCCYPEFRKIFFSIINYYYDHKEVLKDVSQKTKED